VGLAWPRKAKSCEEQPAKWENSRAKEQLRSVASRLGDVVVQSVRTSRVCQAYSRRRTLPNNQQDTASSCGFTMHAQQSEDAPPYFWELMQWW